MALHALKHVLPLCRLYRSTIPLTDAIVRELRKPVEHLLICDVEEMVFDKPDVASGPWRNYCTGIIGPVAHKEEDVLWPNQVGENECLQWTGREIGSSQAGNTYCLEALGCQGA